MAVDATFLRKSLVSATLKLFTSAGSNRGRRSMRGGRRGGWESEEIGKKWEIGKDRGGK